MIASPATFAITAKEITITPTAGQSKVYGTSDPVFAYTNSEWADNTNFTGALGRESGETVAGSPYDYTLGDLDAGTNYSLVMTASLATFAITVKEITITPTAGQSKVYGSSDPVFAYTNSEWANNTNLTGALGRETGETISEERRVGKEGG